MRKFIICFLFVLIGCSSDNDCSPDNEQEFSKIKILMGTTVEIKVISNNKSKAGNSILDAFNEIVRIENRLSVYKPTSDISRLNREGSAVLDDEIINLIKKAKYFYEISDGAFDITVLPLIKLWRDAKKKEKIPSQEEIDQVRKLVNSKCILIDEKSKNVAFTNKGMEIDLGGIAKGYAVDKAVEILEKSGIKAGLVNAGGDIRVFGERDWKIALQNPRDKNDYITLLKLKNKSVTTSGDYERFFLLDKKKIHHILDPSTGYSAEKSISSTIITDIATDADALATATFILGPEKGLEVANKGGSECLIIDHERKIYKTKSFSKYEE